MNDIHHLSFWVGNAFLSASFFVTRFGFTHIAYRGLETGSREVVTHVVKKNKITLSFSSTLMPGENEISRFCMNHGDAIRDVALLTDDCKKSFTRCTSNMRSLNVIQPPTEYRDENGSVVIATIKAFGDVVHSLIEIKTYNGPFLPHFVTPKDSIDAVPSQNHSTCLGDVDHFVGNFYEGEVDRMTEWYTRVFGLDRKYEYSIATANTSLRTVIVGNPQGTIKIPLIEPIKSAKKGQNEEYLEYNGGPGIQHVAFHTDDICKTVTQLRARGVKFQEIPASYYDYIRTKLQKAGMTIDEDLEELKELRILIDFDENGYLLQIFTRIIQDRPTLFIEIIQRKNHEGFGEGNIQSLFECVERAQEERGNLL